MVSGVGVGAYWLSTFAIDILKYSIPGVFSVLMVLAFKISIFTDENSAYGAVCLLFLLYGWGVFPFTYLFGYLFNSFGNAQIATFFMNFLTGGLIPTIVYILRLIPLTRKVGLALQWVFRCIPSFCFGYGILNISNRKLYANLD